jgi:hypothetical protein
MLKEPSLPFSPADYAVGFYFDVLWSHLQPAKMLSVDDVLCPGMIAF